MVAFHVLKEHTSQTLARHLNRPVNHVLSLLTHQRIQVVYDQMYMKLTVQEKIQVLQVKVLRGCVNQS